MVVSCGHARISIGESSPRSTTDPVGAYFVFPHHIEEDRRIRNEHINNNFGVTGIHNPTIVLARSLAR
jgi:hypothetical protein